MTDQGRAGGSPIRFKTTFTNTVYEAMKLRGWRETTSDLDWDLIWAERKRSMRREGQHEEADRYDFWPTTYVLPGEYALFVEESKRRPNSKWIMKPIARSQGRGIFIVTKLSQISKWKSDSRWEKTKEDGPETYIVQRYVADPYLVAGRKFDMRLYVLVTSYMPMTVWVYRAGFCRFSHVRYSTATADLEDMEKHLTNIAIQKRTESYDKEFGGKWDIRQLKLHLMGLHGVAAVDKLFYEIQSLILRSLLSVQQVMINDKHCFGLYGYDIIFDDRLKPWLLEVNASPSLSANTPTDKELKLAMLSSVLDVVDLEGRNHGDEIRIGGFDLIHTGGSIPASASRAGDSTSIYSTAIGAEIPRQRVDRVARAPESSLPPSGAGNGKGSEVSRRSSQPCAGGGTGSNGGETREARGQSSCVGRVNGRGSMGGVGGASSNGGCGTSASTRSSSSLVRGLRMASNENLSREGRGDVRSGRSEGVQRGISRGETVSGVSGGSKLGSAGKSLRCAERDRRHKGRDRHQPE